MFDVCGRSGFSFVKWMAGKVQVGEVLGRGFYQREVLDVARDMLGAVLVRRLGADTVRLRIVETEAYHERERGSHSYGGRRTARNAAMFGDGGAAYVYFIYGMYWMFNVVTGTSAEAAAVLVRAGEPIEGQDLVAARRGWSAPGSAPRDLARWCDGPGKVAQALAIDRSLDGVALEPARGIWLESGEPVANARVVTGPRVGIAYAGEDALLPWRFRCVPSTPALKSRP